MRGALAALVIASSGCSDDFLVDSQGCESVGLIIELTSSPDHMLAGEYSVSIEVDAEPETYTATCIVDAHQGECSAVKPTNARYSFHVLKRMDGARRKLVIAMTGERDRQYTGPAEVDLVLRQLDAALVNEHFRPKYDPTGFSGLPYEVASVIFPVGS